VLRFGAIPVAYVVCSGWWRLFGYCFRLRLGSVQLVAFSVHDVSGLDF
jgi:hypothetical protein